MRSVMGRLLKNLLSGAREILVLYPDSDYDRPKRGGFAGDLEALRDDAARVGKDIKTSVGRYGTQVDHR